MDPCRRKKVRRPILAATFALALAFSLNQTVALAASTASQTIDLTGYANFSSILGGSINGPVTLSGAISDGQLGVLRGAANFPLRDERLTVAPATSIVLVNEQLNVGWYRYICDPYVGCTFESGTSVFQRSYGSGPVDVRFGSLKGNGTLSLGTNATCVSACPPPNAYWGAPTGFWNLQGAALSSHDAGNFFMNGPAPTIY
jgi:hypothetical protein